VLNFGGITLLGRYVAILTVAGAIQVANRFFADTLLPALTNLLAFKNIGAASEVFSTHLRILFIVDILATCTLMLLINPITHLLGSTYAADTPLYVLLVLFYCLSGPTHGDSGGGGGIVLPVGEWEVRGR